MKPKPLPDSDPVNSGSDPILTELSDVLNRSYRGLDLYILDGHTPRPCADVLEWGAWSQANNCRVRLTMIGKTEVSTVFIGLPMGVSIFRTNARPLLFETMAFVWNADNSDREVMDIQKRCSTWEQAEAQHQRIVDELRKLAPDDEVVEVDREVATTARRTPEALL